MRKIAELFRPVGDVSQLVAAADRYRDDKVWREAAEAYAKVLEQDGSLAGIWVQYGHALKESGQLSEAGEAYRRALALEPTADTYLQLGHFHKLSKDPAEAASCYLEALKLDGDLADARAELKALGWSPSRLRARLARAGEAPAASDSKTSGSVVLELSDLVDYLQNARYPTGIQRVQLSLAKALADVSGADIRYVCFDNTNFMFSEISRRDLDQIVDLVEDDDRPETTRSAMAARLKDRILQGEAFAFPRGSTLVNVGTSWGYHNYFLVLRHIREQFGVRYVPLVHDTIPLLFPEFCNRNLIADYINWIDGMFLHADMVLANSRNTLSDVCKVAEDLGRRMPPAAILPLNGETRRPSPAGGPVDPVLRAHRLDFEDYVLFVSTIEPRKNHDLVLRAWSRMLKRRDGRPVPRLVCVGNRGWMNDGFYARLEADRALAEKVTVLVNVSDEALDQLYARCLFTLFPSLYEGWGLPISEALAHGKVPLVSNVASHPEAGGEHAVYFDLDSAADFQSRLDSLIYDVKARNEREKAIRASTPLRPWSAIGTQLLELVASARQADQPPDRAAGSIETGRLYLFARNSADDLADLRLSADPLRAGLSWYTPEPWGCWARGASCDIALTFEAEAGGRYRIHLLLAVPDSAWQTNAVTVALPGAGWSRRTDNLPAPTFWQLVDVVASKDGRLAVNLRVSSSVVTDFRDHSDGKDLREIGVGLRGLYVADRSDASQHQDLMEALATDRLADLARRKRPEPAVL